MGPVSLHRDRKHFPVGSSNRNHLGDPSNGGKRKIQPGPRETVHKNVSFSVENLPSVSGALVQSSTVLHTLQNSLVLNQLSQSSTDLHSGAHPRCQATCIQMILNKTVSCQWIHYVNQVAVKMLPNPQDCLESTCSLLSACVSSAQNARPSPRSGMYNHPLPTTPQQVPERRHTSDWQL